MTSGYTSIFQDRDDVTLNEFVWRCARHTGKVSLARDPSTGALVPQKFKHDDYHEKEAAIIRQRIIELESMPLTELQKQLDEHYRSALKSHREIDEKTATLASRYKAMIAKVEAWQTPSAAHEDFKKFMIGELNESFAFDCKRVMGLPSRLDAEEHRRIMIEIERRSLEYHLEAHDKYVKETQERNAWVDALRESLGDPPREV